MLLRLTYVFRRLARSRRGVTAIEYALVVALISVTAIAALTTIGQEFQNALDAVAAAVS
jgi:Flp pilus assembly pilin Flp